MTEIGKNLSPQDYEKLKGMSTRLQKAEQNPVAGNISFLIKEGDKEIKES